MNIYGGSDGKESACNARDLCSIPRLGRSPGKGNGYPLLYSCLENPHGQRSLVGHSPWDHKELDTTEQLTLSLFHWWMHSIWDLVPAHMCVRVCVCVCVYVYTSPHFGLLFWIPYTPDKNKYLTVIGQDAFAGAYSGPTLLWVRHMEEHLPFGAAGAGGWLADDVYVLLVLFCPAV